MIVGIKTPELSVIKQILEEYPIEYKIITAIDSYENFIYDIDDRYIMRVSHSKIRNIGGIEAEIEWINFLSDNLNVPGIISINGTLVNSFKYGEHMLYTVIFEKIIGRKIEDKNEMLEYASRWGEITARLHVETLMYNPENKRENWYNNHEIKNIDTILRDYPVIHSMARKLIEKIASYPEDEYGLIHYDLHESNILIADELWIIDFDDSQYDHFASEIAVTLFHLAWRFGEGNRDVFIREFFPIYIQGYRSVRKIPDKELAKIPDFIQLRFFSLFCTVVHEVSIDYDEYGQKLIDAWKSMLNNKEKWISDSSLKLDS
jgi:Ser/Thr protein kinase RdoA (MazF antagonist)